MSSKIRVMSSNIWGNCPANRPISDRDDKLAVIYHRYLPDVIGMQECSPKSRNETLNILNLSADVYEEVPVEPTNAKHNNYTPIIYKRDRLNLIDCGWHFYSGLNDNGSKSLTWALFEIKESGERFLHLNTHFFWTGDKPGRAARVCNTGELLGIYWGLCEKYDCPAFFTGDFNCISAEPPIQTLVAYGLRQARYEADVKSPYRSHHAYPTYHEDENYYAEGVTPNLEPEKSIDHIFIAGTPHVENFVTVIDKESLEATDHCPIYADTIL